MNSENTIVNDVLIVKYLSGEASPEEAMALNEWISQYDNRIYFETLASTWRAAHPAKVRKIAPENAWENLRKHALGDRKRFQRRLFLMNPITFRVAASLLFFVVFGVVIYLLSTRENSYVTTKTLKEILFSDKSKVTLRQNTSIYFPEQFHGNLREIKLEEGEAFFKIEPVIDKPFIIHTPLADIKVVGTSFNVVVSEHKLEVGVSEGRVMLYNNKDSVFLNAGFAGLVSSERKRIQISESADLNAWGYATRKFIFTDTPLRQVIKSIEKAYPLYAINVANESIGNCKMTATFNNDSAENIINLIAESLNLSITRNGTVFILDGQGCP